MIKLFSSARTLIFQKKKHTADVQNRKHPYPMPFTRHILYQALAAATVLS